jgi:2-amino-4-hydroxy-6-hydroxymethyldihydropteridine diphosphokinase
MEIVISLGSNLGDRLGNLVQARGALEHLPRTRVLASSPVYASDPVDCAPGSPEFLNAIVILASGLDVRSFFDAMRQIEVRGGRSRGADRHAARSIDIDLICWGARIVAEPDLQVPHPRAHVRRFVCQPLADVRPALILPGQGQSLRAILDGLPLQPAVRRAAEQWPRFPS